MDYFTCNSVCMPSLLIMVSNLCEEAMSSGWVYFHMRALHLKRPCMFFIVHELQLQFCLHALCTHHGFFLLKNPTKEMHTQKFATYKHRVAIFSCMQGFFFIMTLHVAMQHYPQLVSCKCFLPSFSWFILIHPDVLSFP